MLQIRKIFLKGIVIAVSHKTRYTERIRSERILTNEYFIFSDSQKRRSICGGYR